VWPGWTPESEAGEATNAAVNGTRARRATTERNMASLLVTRPKYPKSRAMPAPPSPAPGRGCQETPAEYGYRRMGISKVSLLLSITLSGPPTPISGPGGPTVTVSVTAAHGVPVRARRVRAVRPQPESPSPTRRPGLGPPGPAGHWPRHRVPIENFHKRLEHHDLSRFSGHCDTETCRSEVLYRCVFTGNLKSISGIVMTASYGHSIRPQ
jgi:hypothetical protein